MHFNDRPWVCDVVTSEIFSPYWGEFRTNFEEKGSKLGFKIFIDYLLTLDEFQIKRALKRYKKLMRHYFVIGGEKEVTNEDIIEALAEEGKEKRMDNLIQLENSNLMVGTEKISILPGDLVVGNETRYLTGLARYIKRYINGTKPIIDSEELVHLWVKSVLNKIGGSGLPSLKSFYVKSLTINSVDDRLLPTQRGLWVILPNHLKPIIEKKYPWTLKDREVSLIRYPKLAIGATLGVKYIFRNEIEYDKYILGGMKSIDKGTDQMIVSPRGLGIMFGDCDGDAGSIDFQNPGVPLKVSEVAEKVFFPKVPKYIEEFNAAIYGKEIKPEEYSPNIVEKLDKQSVAANSIGIFTNKLMRYLLKELTIKQTAEEFYENKLITAETLAKDVEEKSAKYKTEKTIEWVNKREIYWRVRHPRVKIDFGNKYRNAIYKFMTTGNIDNVTGHANVTMREKLYAINEGLSMGNTKFDHLFMALFDVLSLEE